MRTRFLERFLPWVVVTAVTAAMGAAFLSATASPMDDFASYQAFIVALAHGRLDFAIPGFHGSDFLAVPVYLLTRSPVAQIQFQILCALLLPAAAYLAGRSLYRSAWHGYVLLGSIAMMPFVGFVGLRGWTGPANMLLLLLTVWLAAARRSSAAGVAWGFAMLTKPFGAGLFPLLIALAPREGKWYRRFRALLIGAAMVLAYVLVEYLQAGRIHVGVHEGLTPGTAFQGPLRVVLNAAHALQILFSVHNYFFPDPCLTGPGNMMHTTPLLIFLGLFGLFDSRRYFAGRALPLALFSGALIAIGLNVPLDHMDHVYMEAGILLLILAALPVLKRHPVWLPLVLATLHFQWFYFFLQHREVFALRWGFFTVPLVVDGIFAIWFVREGLRWHRSPKTL